MPQVVVNGSDIFFRDHGRGEPIIFGHSSTGSSSQWRGAIEQLENNYRCLAPDHLGYGRSDPYRGEGLLIDQELAVIDALLDLVDGPAHFVGHSFGGALLARSAVRNPDRVSTLTVIEPIFFNLLESQGRHAEFDEIHGVADRVAQLVCGDNREEAARVFIDYWTAPGAFDAMPRERRASTLNGIGKVCFEWEVGFEPAGASADDLSSLRCPIQLIGGSDTTAAAAGVVRLLREIWPSARYSEIAGAGHMSPVTHADAVNAVIADFLASS